MVQGRKEGNVLFNDALNTFYLRLYGVGYCSKSMKEYFSEKCNVELLDPIHNVQHGQTKRWVEGSNLNRYYTIMTASWRDSQQKKELMVVFVFLLLLS